MAGQKSSAWVWVVLVLVLAMGGCLCVGSALLGGVATFLPKAIKSSEPYVYAVARAREDSRVVGVLGEPIEEGWFPKGSIETNPASGKAELAISLSGPEGQATLYVHADKQAGEWRYHQLEVEIDDSDERIDLLYTEPVTSDEPAVRPPDLGLEACRRYAELACQCRNPQLRASMCQHVRYAIEQWSRLLDVGPNQRATVEGLCQQGHDALVASCSGR